MKKILLVEDHPIVLEGYKNILNSQLNEELRITTASDCDSALEKLFHQGDQIKYDLIFLDISIPPSKEKTVLSGEDLGVRINNSPSKPKLIILTSHMDNHRIKNIIKNTNPDGFLIKSQTDTKIFLEAYKAVEGGSTYYSPKILSLLKTEFSNKLVLDDIDRKILFHLSKGTNTNKLPDHIPLSLRAIENRKRKLRSIFDSQSRDDRTLLEKAKLRGFI